MNIESYVAKQNKEQANALYEQERAKTKSAQYLDYFMKWSNHIDGLVSQLDSCVKNYEKRGNQFASQIRFVAPHATVLTAYQGVLHGFIESLQENVAAEQQGTKVTSVFKMHNVGSLDTLFDSLTKEAEFVHCILSGEFDVFSNANASAGKSETASIKQRILALKEESKQR